MTNYNNTIEEVRARVDIVDIISEHVTLKKSGRNWMGLCPFHPEKTPSFMVNSEKNMFKCFGCGVGGDAFSFLQRVTNQSFGQVLTELANRYGIKLEFSSDNQDIKNQIIEVNKLATQYFTESLLNNNVGAKAKEYLNNRGIDDNLILNFSLGFAPAGWDNLIKHLGKKHEISYDLMDKAGLITRKNEAEGYYDRFRDRIIIPIQNVRGQVIAFGGRAMSEENIPKYLNSPETPVFHKGKNLYGLYQAKDSIKAEDSVIIVEGYFDAISAHAHGITNVVATLGTALASDQLRILGKYTDSKRIYFAFDADIAGGSATTRGIEVIKNTFGGLGGIKILDDIFSKESFYEVRVISIPDGKDPDDYIRKNGSESFKNLIKNAPLLIDYQIERVLKANELTTTTGKLNAVKELSEVFAEISSPIIRSEYVKRTAERVSVREDDFLREVSRLQSQRNSKKSFSKPESSQFRLPKDPQDFILTAEKNLISLYFLGENSWTFITSSLKEVNFTNEKHQLIKNSIEEIIQDCQNTEVLTQKLLNKLADDNEAKEIISDIIFSLEDKSCLESEKLLKLFIKENLSCIERFQEQNIENQLRKKYYAAKDDEIDSLQLQYEVRKIVNSRLSAL